MSHSNRAGRGTHERWVLGALAIVAAAASCARETITNDAGRPGLATAGGAGGASGAGGLAGSPGAAGGQPGATGGAAGSPEATAGAAGSPPSTSCAEGERRCKAACVNVGTCPTRERLFSDEVVTALETWLPKKHRMDATDARTAQYAMMDFDGDGIQDVVWATHVAVLSPADEDTPESRFRIAFARGKGNCTFDVASPVRLAERENGKSHGFQGVRLFDVDRDGRLDVVSYADTSSETPGGVFSVAVVVVYPRGGGSFETREIDVSAFGAPYIVDIGRLDAQGGVDVLFSPGSTPGALAVARISPQGQLVGTLTSPGGTRHPERFFDADGDGFSELLVWDLKDTPSAGAFSLLGGEWKQAPVPFWTGLAPGMYVSDPGSAFIADINGDGRLDYVDSYFIWLAKTGTMYDKLPRPQAAVEMFRLEDLDDDGIVDFDLGSGNIPDTYLGDGSGTFVDGPAAKTVSGLTLLARRFVDVDNDGAKDAVYLQSANNTLLCYRNVGGVILK